MAEICSYWFDPTVITASEMYVIEHAALISAVYKKQKLFTALATTNISSDDNIIWMVAKN